VLELTQTRHPTSILEVLEADAHARECAQSVIATHSGSPVQYAKSK
jgi:hypothetical protein